MSYFQSVQHFVGGSHAVDYQFDNSYYISFLEEGCEVSNQYIRKISRRGVIAIAKSLNKKTLRLGYCPFFLADEFGSNWYPRNECVSKILSAQDLRTGLTVELNGIWDLIKSNASVELSYKNGSTVLKFEANRNELIECNIKESKSPQEGIHNYPFKDNILPIFCKDFLLIDNQDEPIKSIQVVDYCGVEKKRLINPSSGMVQVDLSDLPGGTYGIVIVTSSFTDRIKFFKLERGYENS